MELEGSADGTVDVRPGYVDDSGDWVSEGGEGVEEEVEMVWSAAGALIYDLGGVKKAEGRRGEGLPLR